MKDMVFEYKKWDEFLKILHDNDMISIPANEVNNNTEKYIVLKHDVETNVKKAFNMANIEYKYGHRGSYYVQAYLLNDHSNIALLKKMKKMGHEISYHYDVMDSTKGNIEEAIIEFEKNKNLFENNGFVLNTVCQHGNPLVERIGYTSNRDFFRSSKVQELYPNLSDIMVNFKEVHQTQYAYISDAGRKFSLIFDPINNDRINSEEKNIIFNDLNEVYKFLKNGDSVIFSTHPHRWTKNAIEYRFKTAIFKTIRFVAKTLNKIPGINKIIQKFYYLAKKF